MHLAPRDVEKLMVHNAGFMAQKRLARGIRLNHAESVALISTVLHELIREGKGVAELMDTGKRILGRRQVLPNIPDMIPMLSVEGTFPDGSKLVTVREPIAAQDGDLNLAMHGSFLPVPKAKAFESDADSYKRVNEAEVGALTAQSGEITLNEGRETISLTVTNTGDRPVQVGSHYHFVETNPALQFDRSKAYGMRLDIPSGGAIRFEPGDVKTVNLVEIGGNQIISGGNAVATGPVSEYNRSAAMQHVKKQHFSHKEER